MFSNKKRLMDGYGNAFFGNMTVYLLSKKYNLGAQYQKMKSIKQHIHNDDQKKENNIENFQFEDKISNFNKSVEIKDKKIIELLDTKCKIDKNTCYIINDYCQNPLIVHHIVKYFNDKNNYFCQKILKNNIFRNRYNNNNDLFIHIRAGDIFSGENALLLKKKIYPEYDFYKNILEKIKNNFDNIYISSDNLDNEICKKLKENYKVTIYKKGFLDTLMFGSTCKELIISSGSYSFLFGLFSLHSKKVYFDKNAGQVESKKGVGIWHQKYYSQLKLLNR